MSENAKNFPILPCDATFVKAPDIDYENDRKLEEENVFESLNIRNVKPDQKRAIDSISFL